MQSELRKSEDPKRAVTFEASIRSTGGRIGPLKSLESFVNEIDLDSPFTLAASVIE